MNWTTIQFCEIDPFCQKVLAKNFPGVPIHDDLKTFDATKFLGFNGILTAGYPCQPFSQAGKRQGENDERHLWPEVFRIVRQCKPTWCVFENVAGHISMGLDAVLSDLESEGYATQAVVIPACATGAPHRRDRVWIVAFNTDRNGYGEHPATAQKKCEWGATAAAMPASSFITNAINPRLQGSEQRRTFSEGERASRSTAERDQDAGDANGTNGEARSGDRMGEGEQAWSSACNAGDAASAGLPDWAGGTFRQPSPITEWRDGKEWETLGTIRPMDAGVSARLVRDRVSKLKALGNAIVPTVVYQIFLAIQEAQKEFYVYKN